MGILSWRHRFRMAAGSDPKNGSKHSITGCWSSGWFHSSHHSARTNATMRDSSFFGTLFRDLGDEESPVIRALRSRTECRVDETNDWLGDYWRGISRETELSGIVENRRLRTRLSLLPAGHWCEEPWEPEETSSRKTIFFLFWIGCFEPSSLARYNSVLIAAADKQISNQK